MFVHGPPSIALGLISFGIVRIISRVARSSSTKGALRDAARIDSIPLTVAGVILEAVAFKQ